MTIVPTHIRVDSKNENWVLFYDMMGSYFDVFFNYIKMLENINDRLLRIKANLLPRCEKTKRHSFHKDLYPHFDIPNRLTAIYYVNTNNGWTEFENGDKVPSVENRILIFDSSLPHTGTRATNASSRVVINFNYVSSWG